jgi:hypothetical protein
VQLRRTALVLVLAAGAAACGTAPPPAGPRLAGVDSRAFVADAEVVLRYRYEPHGPSALTFYVDAAAKGAAVRGLGLALSFEGFELVEGAAEWSGDLAAGASHSHQVQLRKTAGKTGTVTVTSASAEGVELARDSVRLLVVEGDLRECRPDDEGCG